MSNEAVSFGIITNDPLVANQPRYQKMTAAAQAAAKIFAHHIDGESRSRTVDSVLSQPGYQQLVFAKAVEHELDIHQANQESTAPSGVAEMSLRIASNAAFQMDSLRIHNAVTLPEQKHDLGEAANKLVEECRANRWKANEVREQARGNYTALPATAQMEVADDIATMRHMSAATQEFGWNTAQAAEKAFLERDPVITGPSIQQGIPMDQAVGM